MASIISIIQKNALLKPLQTACIALDENEEEFAAITYEELDRKARAIAAYLQNKTTAGQRVLLVFPTDIAFISAFLGCLYAGVVAVPIFWSENGRKIEFLREKAQHAGITGILTLPTLATDLEKRRKDLAIDSNVFITDCTRFADCSILYLKNIIKPQTIAYLQYTSGSTQSPKAISITHEMLLQNIKNSGLAWRYTKKSIMLNWAPHEHIYGLVCGILLPLYHQSLLILMSPTLFLSKPISWLRAITKYRVTHSGCPNFGYDLCLTKTPDDQLDKLNLNSWKVAVNGGEPIKYDTLVAFSQKFKAVGFHSHAFCCAYGMSELAGTIAVTNYHKRRFPAKLQHSSQVQKQSKHIMMGTILPHLTVRIVDPLNGNFLADGKVGEICIHTKFLPTGYWQGKEDENACFNYHLPGSKKRYFRTGDLGISKKNEIAITGRIKDLIIRYGKNYYPADIEAVISANLKKFPVGKQIAFSILISDVEEVIILQEVLTDLTLTDQNRITYSIRLAVLKGFGLDIHQIILIKKESLPRTVSGKLIRTACIEQFHAKKLAKVKTLEDRDPKEINKQIEKLPTEVLSSFMKLLADTFKLPPASVDLRSPMSTYALDSIKATQFIAAFNEHFNFSLKPDVLYEYENFSNFITSMWQANQEKFITDQTPHKTNIAILPETNDKPISLKIKTNYQATDMAIIGIDGRFPGANNTSEFWQNLLAGKNPISLTPEERWPRNIANFPAGLIDDIDLFDANFFNISPREAELIDPQQRLFLQSVWKTIEDAGYAIETLSQKKVGLFVGAFSHDYAELIQKADIMDAYIATGTQQSILANRVSYLLNLSGPSMTINTACSSSLVALHLAVKSILQHDCELALVGGINLLISPTSYFAAEKAGMLSTKGRCSTFDASADGYVRAEGMATLLLKSATLAIQDSDHIYGIIKGTAINHGGHVSSLTAPNPNAQAEVIIGACQQANIDINTVNYIETHGTGTALGDPIEITGLKKAFQSLGSKNDKPFCGLGALKTHIGHLEAAAGVASIIKVLLSMQHKMIPKNLHFNELNSNINLANSPFYLMNENTPWQNIDADNNMAYPRRAGVSSFGFGGSNAHVILEEPPLTKDYEGISAPAYLIALSAKTEEALAAKISQLLFYLQNCVNVPSLSSLSFTLNGGRDHFAQRAIIVASTIAELIASLSKLAMHEPDDNAHINKESSKIQPIVQELCSSITNDLADLLTNQEEYRKKLLLLGNFYTLGYTLNWEKIHTGTRQKMSLPTYPFIGQSFWIDTANELTLPQTQTRFETNLTAIKESLIDHIHQILKVKRENIDYSVPLSSLGFDSLSFKQLASVLEQQYEMTFTPTIFYTYTNLEQLSQYINNIYNPRPASCPQDDVTANQETIAIVGMQGYFPQSKDYQEFWQHLIDGDDLITEIPKDRWHWEDYYGDAKKDPTKTNCKWGGFIPGVDLFDAPFFNTSAREANLMDPQHRLFLEIVWKTIEDAGYDPISLSDLPVGVFVGMEFNEYQTLVQSTRKIFHAHIATGNSHALLANRVSYFFNFHGPSEVINTSCSSSLVAIHQGVQAIRNGECQLAIVGGVSLILDPDTLVITSQLGALSPDGHCKTFDKSANGYVKGEGVAAVMLKPLVKATQDGDSIYGIIKGSAVNHGGKAQSLTAPNAKTQCDLLTKVYQEAQIDPATISYIETHGTGTELGDPVEIEGLKQAFQQLLPPAGFLMPFCGLGSVKSNIGHLEPASGMAGLFKVLLAMKYQKIPGNLHLKELNPYIKLDNTPFYLVNKTQEWYTNTVRRAGISSFGFGGTCAHLVIEESPPLSRTSEDKHSSAYLITLSAKQPETALQKIQDLYNWLEQAPHDLNLSALSYTLNVGRSHFQYRHAFVINSIKDLQLALKSVLTGQPLSSCYSSEKIPDSETVAHELSILAQHYVNGDVVDFKSLYKQPQRMSGLPSYPFVKQRYWYDLEFSAPQTPTIINTPDFQAQTIYYLQSIFAQKLRLQPENVLPHETYEVYGVDSPLSVEIATALENDLGTLSATLLYEYNTIQELAKYLIKNYEEKLRQLFRTEKNSRSDDNTN